MRADIQVEKILLTPNPTAGSSVVFRVIVSNLGPAPASHILVRDLLPPGLIYQSHVAATGTYDPPTGQYDIPALATFTSTSMLITAILDSCDPLTNCATFLGHSVRDPNPANDSACVTVTAVSPCGAIRGLKFQDTNRDGSPSGDAPFSGQTIRLRNSSGTVKTQITPGSGQYSFSPLPPDTYKVTENLFYGQVQTAPLGGKHIINLASGAQLNGMDFGNYSCPSPPPSTCVPPPMDMVAWWPLDSIVSGSAGCAYSMDMIGEVADRVLGAPSGATSCGPTPAGAVDGAITFDGVDDYVEAQNRAALNFGAASCLPNVTNPNFTIDAYVKTSSTGTQMIVDKRREQSGTVQGYSLFTLGGRLWLQLATASGLSNYDSGASVNTNTWRHVAVTVDRCSPTGIKFYVDGVMAPNQGNPLARTGTLVNSFPLRIGRRSDSSNPGLFAGGIDEVEIFRSVLSQIDIQKIMDHGKCKRSRCHGPTAVTFCANETSKKVPVTICNWSGATDTFHWSVAGLWSGFPGGCSVEGPTDMSPQSGVTPPLPPGKCTTVIISVARPANLAPGQTTCFQTRVAEDSTGECFDCLTRATASTTWCMKGPGDFYQDVTIVPLDGSKTLGFEIRNDHAEFQTLNYEFEVVPSDTEAPPNQVVRLNGLPPGTPVTGSLQVPLEGVTTLSVDASYLHNDALQFYDVVLSLNDATQTLVPMGSVGLRSVNPDRTPDACDAALPSSQILLAWASKSYISWTGGACAGLYNVYRTTGVRLQDSDHDGLADSYGSCFDLGLTEPELFDRSVPSSGSLHFYLVSGMNAQGEGSLGTNRAGVQRPNVEPCSP